jgi:hypothetical protein
MVRVAEVFALNIGDQILAYASVEEVTRHDWSFAQYGTACKYTIGSGSLMFAFGGKADVAMRADGLTNRCP